MVNVSFGNFSHQGAREYQEDAFGYSDITDGNVIAQKGFAAVLADGMGGLANGKEISSYVVSAFIKMFGTLNYNLPFSSQLTDIVTAMNREVCKKYNVNGKSGGGSTIVAAFVYKTKLYWICVGDSRLYILRNGRLYAVNEDHDYFNQLLINYMEDEISMEQIKSERQKDSLTSFIGNDRLPFIDVSKKGFTVRRGDVLILCSDGIYNGISDAEIINIVVQNKPQKASEMIARNVLGKNMAGQDNLTVMVIKLEE